MDLEHILRNIEALESEIRSSERYAVLSAAGLFAVLLLQIDHAFLDFFWFLPAFVVVLFLLRVTMLRSRQAELREMFPPEFKLHQPRRGSLFVFLGVVLAKKYSFLRIAYNIFMYGLILAILAFAYAFAMPGESY